MRLWVSLVIISRLWLFAMPAAAQVTAVAGGNPNHVDLLIPVTASVALRDGVAIGGTYTAPAINAGFTHDIDFTLQCSVLSRVAVESVNGGLLAPVGAPPQGYAALAPTQKTRRERGCGQRQCALRCAVAEGDCDVATPAAP
jgi:hypothetical protein